MQRKISHDLNSDIRKKNSARRYKNLLVIGWREWIALPDLGMSRIKVKVDTGARTSALHAFDMEEYMSGRHRMVRFKIHPFQRDLKHTVTAQARIVDRRVVKDSGGKRTLRPVIKTVIKIGDLSWEIELTLINRDEMGFRMLLGREALKGHLLVNPSRSFIWN